VGAELELVFPDQDLVVVTTTTNYRLAGAAALTDKLIVEYVLDALHLPSN
jgi:hypothetical protein